MRTFKFKAVSVAISMALALALPFGVMAADFSDGAAAEDTWDDVEFDAPVEGEVSGFDFGFGADFDEPEFAPSEASDEFGASFDAPVGDVQEEAKYFFYYNDPEKKDFSVYYGKEEDSATYIGQADIYKEFPADCENDAYFLMVIDVRQDSHVSDKFNYKETDPKYKRATGHTWKTVIAEDDGEGNGCTSDDNCPCHLPGVTIHYVDKCTVCGLYNSGQTNPDTGIEIGQQDIPFENSTEGTRLYDGHKWSDWVTVYLNTQMQEITAAEVEDDSWVVNYRLCQNTGCDHVEYEIKKVASLVFQNYTAGTNVENDNEMLADIPEEYANRKELTETEASKVDLIDCTKDGTLIANFVNYNPLAETFCKADTALITKVNVPVDENKPDGGTKEVKVYSFNTPAADDTTPVQNKINVPKHHTYKYKYVLKNADLSEADAGMYVNIYDGPNHLAQADNDGLYDIDTTIGASKYCVDFEIEKIKTTVCSAENHTPDKKAITTSEGTVVAKATPNSHLIKTELTRGTYPTEGAELTFANVNDLKSNKNVVVTSDVTDCTVGGNGTAAYKCELCGQVINSTKVNFKILPAPDGHKYTKLEMTEVVDATCTSAGSYIPVLTCEYCGKQTVGTKQVIAKLDHVYDNVSPATINVDGQIVVGDAWGKDTFKVGAQVGTLLEDGILYVGNGEEEPANSEKLPTAKISLTRKCTICGKDYPIEDLSKLTATVTAITKEGEDGVYCKDGSVTLKIEGIPDDGWKSLEPVSDEVTLRYYSSGDEYKARYAAHTPSAVVKSNEVEPTETEAGGYDEVINCVFCGKVISQRHVTIPATGHTHDMVAVEAKDATCTEAGNIAYYECKKCGLKYKTEAGAVEDLLTDEEVIIPATGHDMDFIEAKEPSCVEGHEAYYYCHTEDKMFLDEDGKVPVEWAEIKIDPTEEHIPKEPELVTRDGAVFSVVFCDRCGTELSAEPYKGETVELLAGPKTFNLKANKPNKGYMEFKLGEVEGAEKYRVSYRVAGTKEYTRQESDNNVVKVTDLERGQIYDFTACACDVLEDDQIQWGARALKKDGTVKYARRWYETVEQSKIDKKGTVITLEWTALKDASKYEISIADNKEMNNAVTVDAAMFNPSVGGETIHVSADITKLPDFEKIPAGATMKFYVRIRPYTLYGESHVPGGVSNLRAKTIKF